MIRLDGVVKRFGARTVLDGVSFAVPEGRTLALLGRSGTGKSVILKHIVGLLRADAGTVTVDGHDVAALDDDGLAALRREIGYVFQFAALFDSMTCEENLRLALARRGLDEAEIAERIAAALATVGLPDVGPRYPAELSGGMRKRVGIARAVVIRPRYILWDEPTTGLDPVTTATMDLLMQRVRAELGVTAVVVTHDLRSAFAVADEIAFLHEGRIRAHASVTAFQASEDPIVRQFLEGRPE
ncbi:MAG TPA: ATP-binding cassette domain-containing protein [Gemmatimonadales bacterium]|nr:ATP-binding cassette domain-containing protein [Gemmatimonadales bacterium]